MEVAYPAKNLRINNQFQYKKYFTDQWHGDERITATSFPKLRYIEKLMPGAHRVKLNIIPEFLEIIHTYCSIKSISLDSFYIHHIRLFSLTMLWTIERSLLHCCNATARLFPRTCINLLFLWGLYTILTNLYLLQPALVVILGAPALLFLALSAIAYNQVWYIGPGSPFEIPELHCTEESVPACIKFGVMAKREGGHRYCQKCQLWKPDRAHHCSSCHSCRLRMDHHCPWFSTCIGFNNHKPFLQSLWYIAIFCVFSSIISSLLVFNYFGANRYMTEYIDVNLLLFMIMSSVFALVLCGFAAYTTWLAMNNTTTIESLEKDATIWRTSLPYTHFRYREAPTMSTLGNLWDLGSTKNVNQILGKSWLEWLLPISARHPPDFNGLVWPINDELFEQAESRAQTERELLARHY